METLVLIRPTRCRVLGISLRNNDSAESRLLVFTKKSSPMSTTIESSHSGKPKSHKSDLQVSAYDQVASMVVALLILVGFFTVTLFLLWLTTRVYSQKLNRPVEYLEDLGESGENALGMAEEFEPPGVQELPDVEQPQLSDTLQAVTDVVSTQAATLDILQGNSSLMGKGSGLGDHRKIGPGGIGGKRPDRKINYITSSEKAYSRQLDFFKIELGVMRHDSESLEYAANFSQAQPTTRSGPKRDEKRNFFLWTDNDPLAELDWQLLEKANIRIGQGVILQFWPEDSWQLLLHAEADHAKVADLDRTSVRRTDFGVKTTKKKGYELFVMDQTYR